jgi:16S rRNA (guanine966-N2)-methyltransferase|tara:strand:+ start:84 stop:671 length:588 start_codon:yes stop_codon:yes gene_type:complete
MKHAIKQQIKNPVKGSIRIIAGKYRGRKLPVLMSEGLRPTTDRVKETVFNWLMPYVQDAKCLDCFAGSGSLGFEALSRGAKQVTLLELNKSAASQLKANKLLLKAEEVKINQTNTVEYLKGNIEKYDLVFLDPPFRKKLAEQCAILLNSGWLAEKSLIYVEMEANDNAQQLPNNWCLLKEKIAGQVSYQLYQYQP